MEYQSDISEFSNVSPCYKIYLKDTMAIHLVGLKISSYICPKWTLCVPRNSREQFSQSEVTVSLDIVLRKLLASRNIECPRTDIRAYFRTKWMLLFIYVIMKTNLHDAIRLIFALFELLGCPMCN